MIEVVEGNIFFMHTFNFYLLFVTLFLVEFSTKVHDLVVVEWVCPCKVCLDMSSNCCTMKCFIRVMQLQLTQLTPAPLSSVTATLPLATVTTAL